jgi:hypothetical protein
MALLNPVSRGGLTGSGQRPGRAWLALIRWLVIACPAAFVQAAPIQEYQIKAVFLFNFAQFVDWPPATFPDEKSPLIIGVLGKDPFDGSLEEAVRGETVNGRPLLIRRYSRIEEIGECEILFISRSEAGRLERIFNALKGRSTLTVGDSDGFAQQGGMIRFVTEQNKVRFRINLESAKAASLTISSKLLRPANIIVPGKD